jgi:AraC-like DNA-binding protein
MAVGVTYRVMGQLLGSPDNNWLVWFSHSAPKDITTHLRVFGPRVELGAINAIICTARDLDTPLPAGDPVMARHVKQYLEPLLARVNATVSDQVRQLVYELLPSGRCSVKRIASSIGADRRTLHRHLARDGETFSSIVGTARADLARRYVKDCGRSLSEVAYLLGFSGASAFSRWFRERFGHSPTSWRTVDHDKTKVEIASSGRISAPSLRAALATALVELPGSMAVSRMARIDALPSVPAAPSKVG